MKEGRRIEWDVATEERGSRWSDVEDFNAVGATDGGDDSSTGEVCVGTTVEDTSRVQTSSAGGIGLPDLACCRSTLR